MIVKIGTRLSETLAFGFVSCERIEPISLWARTLPVPGAVWQPSSTCTTTTQSSNKRCTE